MDELNRRPQVCSHRDLIVWQKSMDLCVEAYRISSRFPPRERYRLVDQLTRAAVSVPANIAEGSGRGSTRDYARFLGIAKGSLMELQTFFDLSLRLNYVRPDGVAHAHSLVVEVSKMLTALRKSLEARALGVVPARSPPASESAKRT
jgi:four helix bundle protein